AQFAEICAIDAEFAFAADEDEAEFLRAGIAGKRLPCAQLVEGKADIGPAGRGRGNVMNLARYPHRADAEIGLAHRLVPPWERHRCSYRTHRPAQRRPERPRTAPDSRSTPRRTRQQ